MEEKTNKDSGYPTEYAHVEKLVKDTQESVRQMDLRIDNQPPDRGPGPHYSPPGFLQSRQPGNRNAAVDHLKAAKDTLKTERFNRVEKETRDANPETRALVRSKARETLFPNPYRAMTDAERGARQGESRNLEQSQDYMDALRYPPAPEPARTLDESQDRMSDLLDEARGGAAGGRGKVEPNAPSLDGTASASVRFTQTLHWSPGPDKREGPSEPTRHRDAEMDRD